LHYFQVAYRALTSKQRQDLHLNVAVYIRNNATRELNGQKVTPQLKAIELLYHFAMGQDDQACYHFLDEVRYDATHRFCFCRRNFYFHSCEFDSLNSK
jgi:hypothetical protein